MARTLPGAAPNLWIHKGILATLTAVDAAKRKISVAELTTGHFH
jgi:hypothetical protein